MKIFDYGDFTDKYRTNKGSVMTVNSPNIFYGKISKILPLEFCHYFTHVLLKQAADTPDQGDTQVPNALSTMGHHIMFDTILERLWPTMESIVGEELLPTYSYARLYSNGDILEKHTDRPSCEISLTIQLGRSHHYSWPIYAGTERFDLSEGDAVIYTGCDVPHWRDICDGPTNYYSGQLFLHYVRKNGPYADHAGDKFTRESVSFIKNRTAEMEVK
jgi:hypothetical protein